MFEAIRQIINHTYVTQNAGDQSTIYGICGALIIILTVTMIDLFYRLIRGICRKGEF